MACSHCGRSVIRKPRLDPRAISPSVSTLAADLCWPGGSPKVPGAPQRALPAEDEMLTQEPVGDILYLQKGTHRGVCLFVLAHSLLSMTLAESRCSTDL